MTTPRPPGYDAGHPSQSNKLCAKKLPGNGGWCTKRPLHDDACEGVETKPIDTSGIQSSLAQGTPKR